VKTLELLIVGDAEYFLKYETEFDHWKAEIQQLLADMSKLQSDDLDIDGLMHLRALCNEVRRVLPDVVYYLDRENVPASFKKQLVERLMPRAIESWPRSSSLCSCQRRCS